MKLGVQHLDDSWFLVFLFSTQALNRSFHSHFFEEVHVARAAAAFGVMFEFHLLQRKWCGGEDGVTTSR